MKSTFAVSYQATSTPQLSFLFHAFSSVSFSPFFPCFLPQFGRLIHSALKTKNRIAFLWQKATFPSAKKSRKTDIPDAQRTQRTRSTIQLYLGQTTSQLARVNRYKGNKRLRIDVINFSTQRRPSLRGEAQLLAKTHYVPYGLESSAFAPLLSQRAEG